MGQLSESERVRNIFSVNGRLPVCDLTKRMFTNCKLTLKLPHTALVEVPLRPGFAEGIISFLFNCYDKTDYKMKSNVRIKFF